MMDWFAAVMTLVGVLVGVGVQEFRIWRERKDRYKNMVFQKRLDAHQGAYYWCMRLMTLMRPDRLMREGGVGAAIEKNWEASEWLNKNALYLDKDSRSKMIGFVRYIGETSLKYKDEGWKTDVHIKEETLNVVMRAGEVVTTVEKGIGVDYLPKQKTLSENIRWIEIEQELGKIVKSKDFEV